MEYQFLELSTPEPRVAVIKLNRPKMNALSLELLEELFQVLDGFVKDPPAGIVIWGGERIFAAGADIEQLSGGQNVAAKVTSSFHKALDLLGDLSSISIAAISGYALGGGLELALACDFRIMASSAKLGLPEILLGVIPGGGGTQRLARLVGPSRAKELILSGRHVGSEEALMMGLVNKVVDGSELYNQAIDWATRLAAGPIIANGIVKQAIDLGIDRTLEEGLVLEQQLFEKVFESEDSSIGIRSFIENGPGKAKFVGK